MLDGSTTVEMGSAAASGREVAAARRGDPPAVPGEAGD